LVNIHDNVFKEDGQQVAEITKFCIDKPHRKAYVANNLGQIIVINCQSGVIIKSVTDDEEFEQLGGNGGEDGSDVSSQEEDVEEVLGTGTNAQASDAMYG
jgi:pantothenate kinase